MGGNTLLIRLLATWSIIQGAAYWANAGTYNVDDSDPGIQYYPSDSWNIGNDCPNCVVKPDQLSLIYQQTWHDVTSRPGNGTYYFDYSFTGTDLYVYGILADLPGRNVNLILTIDGQNYTYAHATSNTNSYEYQVPVFSIHDLPFQLHDIRVTLVPLSIFLFDYLVFVTPDSTSASPSGTSSTPSGTSASPSGTSPTLSSTSTSPSSTSPTPSLSGIIIYNSAKSTLSPGAIAGIVIGAIAVIVAIAALIGFLCYRRGREERRAEARGGVTHSQTFAPMTAQVLSNYPTFFQRASEPVPQPRDTTLPYTPPPPISPPSYTETWSSDPLTRQP